jgi:ATP-binding cassette subfamily B protein
MEVTTKAGAIIPVISYSLTVAAKFSEAARGIEQLAKGEPLAIKMKFERLRCAKCGRLLPEKDGICPACVNRRKTFMRILGFMKPHQRQAIALALLAMLSTSLTLINPQIQGMIVDQVLATAGHKAGFVAHRSLLEWLMGHLLPHVHGLALLADLMVIWVAVIAALAGMIVVNGRLTAYLGANIAADIRSAVYRALEFLQLTYYDKKQVGAIQSRVTQDTDRVWGFLVDGMPYFVINGLTLIGVLTFLFTIICGSVRSGHGSICI